MEQMRQPRLPGAPSPNPRLTPSQSTASQKARAMKDRETAKEKEKEKAPSRMHTRSKTPSIPTPTTSDEIHTPEQARQYLESFNISVPTGTSHNAESLTAALYLAANLPNVPITAKNAMHSVAILLSDAGIEASSRAILANLAEHEHRDSNKLSTTISDKLDELKETLKESLAETTRAVEESLKKASTDTLRTNLPPASPTSFRDAVLRNSRGATTSVDPRLQAKEAIKKRQVLLDVDMTDPEIQRLDNPSLLKLINEKITKVNWQEKTITGRSPRKSSTTEEY
jgi:hypothetical protein